MFGRKLSQQPVGVFVGGAFACEDPPVNDLLTVVTPDGGTIKINGQVCAGGTLALPHWSTVSVEAIAGAGHSFLNWSPEWAPDFCGNPATFSFMISSNGTIEGFFHDDPIIRGHNT